MTDPQLIGEHVILFPYLRQHAPRDMIYLLWLLIDRDGDWKNIFWMDKDEPEWTLGDLPYFVNYVHCTDPKIWYMVVDIQTEALIGAAWVGRIEDGEAHSGFWMAKGHRHKAREVVMLATQEAFRQGFKVIHATSPHAKVLNLLRKCGYEDLGSYEGVHFLRRVNDYERQRAEDQNLPG